MKSVFRNRLFRLFLLFSIIPALILTVFGVYLAVEGERWRSGPAAGLAPDVADYYNDLLFQRIAGSLHQYQSAPAVVPALLDFLLLARGSAISSAYTTEPIDSQSVSALIATARIRSQGFVTSAGRVYQYVSAPMSDTVLAIGGIVQGPAYAAMIQQIQESRASSSVTRELRPRYALFLALLFVGISAVMIATAYLFSARISTAIARPLMDLGRASERIAEGDFDQSVQLAGHDEIRDLIANFNRMADQLKHTTARLAQTERVAAWQQVARRFAHELKNPLQPILVSLYRIDRQTAGSDLYERIREPLQAASDELRSLMDLADRFSSLAKTPPPAIKPVDVTPLLRSIMELYEPQLRSFQVRMEIPDADVVVAADAAYLREALHNILQNAIDASEVGGDIGVRLTTDDRRAFIEISDTGCGMDAATLAQARLPYFTTKRKGTGLGLAIVEKAVGDMGGELMLESKPNEGTIAVIALPRRETGHGSENPDSR